MRLLDLHIFTLTTLRARRLHSSLTALGISVGIGAVILLTSLGEGLQRYVLSEFTQFGSNLIAINPGKVTTMGTPVGIIGSERLLTLEDAEALAEIPAVETVVPAVQGNGEVEYMDRRRRLAIYGVGPGMAKAFRMRVARGRFLPEDNPRSARALAVLGHKASQELFGDRNPLGERIKIGGIPCRVIGIMERKGQILGLDMDDTVYLPTLRVLDLFDRDGLMEIDILYRDKARAREVEAAIKRVLLNRHGQEDFTITTQEQMLNVLDKVLGMLTVAVAALGGVSLLVGSVGILTVMTIAVSERTAEIGLLRALGAGRGGILVIFLTEATVLAALGGLAGLALGLCIAWMLKIFLPALPVHINWNFVILAETTAAVIGLFAGALPARQAAGLDPVEALRSE